MRGASRIPTSVSSSSSPTVHDATPSPTVPAPCCICSRIARHRPTCSRINRASAASSPVSARSSSFAASATVPSGVDSSCAAPAAIVASDARRSCRAARPRASVSSRSRCASARGDPQQEVHDERRRDAERDPRADHAAVLGNRERLVREDQDAEADERQPDEHPRPQRAHEHRRERDLHEIQESERVVRTAGQIEQPGEARDVDHHHERDVPFLDGMRPASAACSRKPRRPPKK